MIQRILFTVLFLFVFLMMIIVALINTIFPTQEKDYLAKELPKIKVTLNGVELSDITNGSKDTKYLGNDLKIYADGKIYDYSDVEIKGRGNWTWTLPKKPFQIKFPEKVNLLGLGGRRKWILLANHMDDTYLRTDVAFYIEYMVGEEFAYQGKFVELYFNDDYEGLYYLTRGVEVGKKAVDLKDKLGILVELDNVYGKMEDSYYVTGNGEHLTVKDLVVKDNEKAAMENFLASFNELEEAVKEGDYEKIEDLVDVESFAKYFLISELTFNTDAYFTSQYFYKDGVKDKIHAGPAWDFDISLNNRKDDYLEPDRQLTKIDNAQEYWETDKQYMQWSRLFSRLIEMPEFRAEVDKVFKKQLSGRKNELLGYILMQASKIYESAIKDSEKWEKGDYLESVKVLLDWMNKRYDYFEREYGGK